ncbi:glycosyltransferase family 2 protein [candidate division KSB1 bacterium]|nr:glycosyltransferase family 2 protein [candidate division KSB1 bacterium]
MGQKIDRFFKDISPEQDFKGDKVSIVITARNEEKEIEVALKSVLAQSYNDFEVIAIDDRSTDQTAEILEGLAKRIRKLQVHYISMLPDDWLGKNHALQYGAKQAVEKLLQRRVTNARCQNEF